jgi:hypothetical protein
MNERQREMQKAYEEATKRLRRAHEAEFHSLLQEVYYERDMNVRKRLTGERKRAADIAKAKELLASNDAL